MIKNILKGFIIGVGKIIPGVSGSMLAISMGVYERALKIISNVKKAKATDFIFLIMLTIGVFIGISVFSKGIKWVLSTCYLPTMLLFIGLILGGFSDIIKEMKCVNKEKIVNIKYIMVFCFAFLFSYFITELGEDTFSFGNFENGVNFTNIDSIWELFADVLVFFVIGLLEAFSSIVPGISGTAIFMSLGCYNLLLSFYANVFNPSFWLFGVFFFIGVVVGIFILAKVITFLFTNYKVATYWSIFGFMLASIVVMINMAFFPSTDSSIVYAFGKVTLKDFINFDSYYWLSLGRLIFCLFMVYFGYFVGIKINQLLESD